MIKEKSILFWQWSNMKTFRIRQACWIMLNKRLISSWHWSSKLENSAYLSNLLDHGQEEINFLLLTVIKRGWKPCAFVKLAPSWSRRNKFLLDFDKESFKTLWICQTCSFMVKKTLIKPDWKSFVLVNHARSWSRRNSFPFYHDQASLNTLWIFQACLIMVKKIYFFLPMIEQAWQIHTRLEFSSVISTRISIFDFCWKSQS